MVRKVFASLQLRVAGNHHVQQLVQGIDLQELDTGLVENLLPGDNGEGLLEHPVCALITIVIRVVPSNTPS